MARDGSGVYSRPANTTAVTDETISSSKFETLVTDIIADLNVDRPIQAGGTAASSAADARSNLSAAHIITKAGAPNGNDDSANTGGNGAVGVGSFCLDTSGELLYYCTDATATAAQWTAVDSGTGDLVAANNLSDLTNAATARTNLGLAIGTDVQAQGAVLDDLNTLGANASDGEFLVGTGAGALAWESGATARTSLGLDGNVTLGGAVTIGGTLDVPGYIRHAGDTDTSIGFFTDTIALYAAGIEGLTLNSLGDVSFGGALTVPRYIYHDGDTDTHIDFETNQISFVTGGGDALVLQSDQDAVFGGNVVSDTNSTYNIGSVSAYWANGYFDGNVTCDRLYSWDGANDYIGMNNGSIALITNNVQRLLVSDSGVRFNALGETISGGIQTTVTDTDENIPTSGAVVDYVAANAGGLVFIESQDLSNDSSVSFTGFSSGSYDAYRFVFQNVIPASDGVELWLRFSTNGGSTYATGTDTYRWALKYVEAASPLSESGAGSDGDVKIIMGQSVGSGSNEYGVSGTLDIFGPHLTGRTACFWNIWYADNGNAGRWLSGAAERTAAEDTDAVRFLYSSGNLESGTITMYGLKNS